MKHHALTGLMMAAAITAAAPTSSDATRYVAHGTMISGPATVRVWVDGGDVFPDYSRVTLWVRPERDCYTSLFMVDTAGFIHVLNAGDGYDEGWLYGGRTYGYRGRDLGLDRLDGRGIAYVFAVGSPVPFDYSYYGAGVRVGGFGFRVAGDPFVGGREFYMSLLPASCPWDYVGVSFTRFYVREWVRYPSYLCTGGHVRVGDGCRHCEPVYASYRGNVASPYEAMRPVVRYKERARYTADVQHVVRTAARGELKRHEPIMGAKTRDSVRVVSTSRELARNQGFEKSRPAQAPVMAREQSRRAAPAVVAHKGRTQKHTSLAPNTREKGADEKVRQAE